MIRIKRAGWAYITLTLLIGIAAINTGNNLIYLIEAALLSFLAVSGFLGRINLSGLKLEIVFPDEIYARKAVPVQVILFNPRRRIPAFLLRVTIEEQVLLYPFVACREKAVQSVDLSFDRRGMHILRNLKISSIFPLNLIVRQRTPSDNFSCIVFPQPVKASPGSWPADFRLEGDSWNQDQKGDDPEVLSIRNYQRGDALRTISWKATARTGTLKTRERKAPSRPPLILDVHRLDLPGLELKLSCATFLLIAALRRNVPVGLRLGNLIRKPGTGRHHKLRLLRDLAEVSYEEPISQS